MRIRRRRLGQQPLAGAVEHPVPPPPAPQQQPPPADNATGDGGAAAAGEEKPALHPDADADLGDKPRYSWPVRQKVLLPLLQEDNVVEGSSSGEGAREQQGPATDGGHRSLENGVGQAVPVAAAPSMGVATNGDAVNHDYSGPRPGVALPEEKPALHPNANLGDKPLQEDNAVEGSSRGEGARQQQGPAADGGQRSLENGVGQAMPPVAAAPAMGAAMNEGAVNDAYSGRPRPGVVLLGAQCSRVDERGWRCNQSPLAGSALCQHHLAQDRRDAAAAARAALAARRAAAGNTGA